MGFYNELSNYYDYIFPVKQAQLNLIKNTTGTPPKKILDVACGSGGYSLALANNEYQLTAVDLDEKMINQVTTKAKHNSLKIDAFEADMLSIDEKIDETFDTIFCIGNSVAHLDTEEQMSSFFKSSYNLLSKGGSFIVQIINYDRILEKGINALPTITNNEIDLTFERKYEYERELNKILFITRLLVDGKEYNNSIPLLPIRSTRFISLIKEAGFDLIEEFGDFNESPYNQQNSYHLVIRATK
ncbi:class I SAM-dependent methyltransferase [Haloplasma contractile]|uniref:Glycine N-methyltransferase protein n=1 Tax=Haloplasma contractile SSD-17B TaxID=1033810 RepID=U2E0C7_9MOLU|nr:class I SAM-dependent methyltransferase [Haloplasma contractile]ERJ13877.1 glycine N-methyltransferase protein [Haloplasma contractile SSD-17B]